MNADWIEAAAKEIARRFADDEIPDNVFWHEVVANIIRRHAPPQPAKNFMDLACRYLPEGWRIEIELEEGAGCVKLINPDRDEVLMCDDDLDADEMLLQRINRARLLDGLDAIPSPPTQEKP